MLPVSAQFDSAIAATIRQIKGRVRITWAGPFVDSGLSITSNGENNVSDDLHIANNTTETEYNWLTLEGTSLLDDTFSLFPEPHQTQYEVGFYGSAQGGAAGNYATNPTINLFITERPVFGITIAGENTKNEYPVDFTVYFLKSSVVQHSHAVTGNTDLLFTYEYYVAACDQIQLVISKWSEPYTSVKILEMYSSIIRTYDGDIIKSISVLEEKEIKDGTNSIGNISSNECTVELQNIEVDSIKNPFFPGNPASFYATLLKPGRKIEIFFGVQLSSSVEYVPYGVYWSGEFNITESSPTMSFTGRDRMEALRKHVYDDNAVATSITLYNFILAILNSALAKIPDLTWQLDTAFSSYTIPISYMGRVSYFDALKKAVASIGGNVYMSKTDVLILNGPDEISSTGSYDWYIEKTDYFNKNQPANYEELINIIELKTQPLEIAGSNSIVYESDDDIDIAASETLDLITVEYTSLPVSGASATLIDVSGCSPTIDDVEYYSWGAVLEIRNTIATPGTFKIRISGYEYTLSGATVVRSTNETSILENGEKLYTLPVNHLIQDVAIAQGITDDLIDGYSDPHNDLVTNWRGHPALELGDLFVFPEYQDDTNETYSAFKIYKIQTEFDGGLKQTTSGRFIE